MLLPMKLDLSRVVFCGLLAASVWMTGCATVGNTGLDPNHPALQQRRAQIAAETPGNYFIGRRYWIEGTRFWGFVRKPNQPWEQAQLVMMNENKQHTPDRLPEIAPAGGLAHGYDHNYEYKLYGRFTGDRIYDPNSNKPLPEFMLERYELISRSPGFIFHPNEVFEKNRIPVAPKF